MRAIGPGHRSLASAVTIAIVAGSPPVTAAADPGDRPGGDPLALAEVVITATRIATPAIDVPALAYVLGRDDVQQLDQSRTLPEALGLIPGVMVQKTSHGQGSPFIRGYTGFRNVLLVDGIRLNNSVFREGANQYWNTVDVYSFNHVEVVKGAASVLYGSDAVGAAVNVLSDIPSTAADGFAPRLLYRYADAEHSQTGRAEATWRGPALRARGGLSRKDYGDLEGGRDVANQPHTGYEETDADARVEYDLDADTTLVAGYQYVSQDDAWRTHRTIYGISWEGTTIGTDRKLSLDQGRRLGYLQLHRHGLGALAEDLHASVSRHRQTEDQYRLRSNLRVEASGFAVDTTGLSAQLEKAWGTAQFVYGFDYYHDAVDSYRTDYNANGSIAAVRIQGPVADDASYDLAGAFAEATVDLSTQFKATLAGRYTYAALAAAKVEDPLTGQPTSMEGHWHNFSSSGRLGFRPRQDAPWMLFLGVSEAFRAPNLSDMTRLDTARSSEIETPVLGLKPETFVTYEAGGKVAQARWVAQAGYFRTVGSEVIVRTPTGRTIDGLREVTKTNAANSVVKGIEAQVSVDLSAAWLAWGDAFWIDGEADAYPTSLPVKVSEPLDVLMPPNWRLGLRWATLAGRLRIEGVVEHADTQDKLSTRDRLDTQRIPPGGTPGYTVVHLRSEWRVLPAMFVSLAVENLGDLDYRIHGSGVNESGRNFVMSLAYTF